MKRRWSRWLWGLLTAGSLALLVYLVLQTRPITIATVWKRFVWGYFLLAQLVYFLLNFLRALRFNVLLKDYRLPWRTLFAITTFYNLSARILPFRSGDLVYPVLLRRHVPGAWSKGFGGVTGSLLFDLLALMAITVVALIALRGGLFDSFPFENALIVSVFVFFLALGAILLIGTLSTSLARFLKRLPGGFWPWLSDRIKGLGEGLSHFRDKRVFWHTLLLSFMITGAIFAFNLILLRGQGVWTGWASMLTCVALGVFVSSMPLALFGLGLIEGAWVLGLVNLAGQSVDQAVALGIFLHACQIAAAVLTAATGFLLSKVAYQTTHSATINK